MRKTSICEVCGKEVKNLRGHLRFMRDKQHQKAFCEYGQTTETKNQPLTQQDNIQSQQTQQPPSQQTSQPQQQDAAIQFPVQDETVANQQSQPQQPWIQPQNPVIQPQILTAVQPQQPQQQTWAQQPQQQGKQIIQIPRTSPPEPGEWMEQFLSQYAGMKLTYIQLQKQRAQYTNELPKPMDFERDLVLFDSGFKNKRPEAAYIRSFYEAQLREYLGAKKTPYSSGGYDMNYPPQDRNYAPGPGISVGQQPYNQYQQYDQYGRPYDQKPYTYPQDGRSSELRELKNELKTIRDDRERQRDREIEQLKLQLQTRPQQDDANRQRFEQLQLELQRERDDRWAEKFTRIENVARSGPSVEDIKGFVGQMIQGEHDRITASDLDSRIRAAVSSNKSITSEDVAIKKIDKDYELESQKLAADKEKTNQWSETVKDVVASAGPAIGTAIGTAMASRGKQQPIGGGGQPTQPTSTNQNIIKCPNPNCGLALELEPGTTFGECPNPDCRTKMEIDSLGNVSLYKGTQPPTGQPMPIPTQRPHVEMRDTTPTHPPISPQSFAQGEYLDMPAAPQEEFQIKKEREPPIPPLTVDLPPIVEEPIPPEQTAEEIYKKRLASGESELSARTDLPTDVEQPVEIEPPPSTLQPQEQDFSDNDDFCGMCMNCGKPVFETGPNMNIGAIDDGKPVCKECHNGTEPT